MLQLKLIIHAIKKTLKNERKMMLEIAQERGKRQLRLIIDAWRFEGKVEKF